MLDRNETTYQRAIGQAKKLQPETKQINNSFFFTVASTSILDAWHHVTLGPNKYNPLLDSKCDCSNGRFCCCHKAAALLQYVSNIEARLWKGCDVITSLEDSLQDSDAALQLWLDLLERYELSCDLLKAIDQGFDISTVNGPIKDRLTGKLLLLTA